MSRAALALGSSSPDQIDIIEDNSSIRSAAKKWQEELDTKLPWLGAATYKHLCLGALATFQCRADMGMREYCLLTYVALGSPAPHPRIKADARGFYTYGNGSWVPFSGVMSEGSLLAAKRYCNALEGLFRLLGAAESCARSEQPFLRTLVREFRRIQEKADFQHMPLEDMLIGEALENAGKRGTTAAWCDGVAYVLQSETPKIVTALINKDVVPFYSEWCADPGVSRASGVAYVDAAFLFDVDGQPVRRVSKRPGANIHIFVPHSIQDPVQEEAVSRVRLFLCTSFWRNAPGLRCCLAAMSLALRGLNVTRCFWSVGPGGVGQSLFTHFLDSMFANLHGYLDMNIYYGDDEFRKQAELLIHKIVVTGQETPHSSTKSMRDDLYKKHMSGDPVPSRLLYSIVTKMVELIGWKRLEMNKLLAFHGVTEGTFASMLRRTLILRMKARFTANPLYVKPEQGLFIADDDLKEFLGSRPAALAGLRWLFGFQASTTLAEARSILEDYVVADPTTELFLREACSLEARNRPQEPLPAKLCDALAEHQQERFDASDSIATALLASGVECTMANIVKFAGNFLSGSKRQHKTESFKRDFVNRGLWRKHGRLRGGQAEVFAPEIRTLHTAESLFGPVSAEDAGCEVFPERLHVGRMRDFVLNEARKLNVETTLGSMQTNRPRGVTTAQQESFFREIEEGKAKVRRQGDCAEKLLLRASNLPVGPDGCVTLHQTYFFPHFPHRTRRFCKDVGVQGMSRILRLICVPDSSEYDIKNCQMQLAPQIARRLSPELRHPVVALPAVQSANARREEFLSAISHDRDEAKKEVFAALNGKCALDRKGPLNDIRQEGRFCRWLATSINPELYEKLKVAEKRWPEASCWSHTIGGVEDWALQAMHAYVTRSANEVGLRHLSLEFDGIRVDDRVAAAEGGHAALCLNLSKAIQDLTGYTVEVARKESWFLLDRLKSVATCSHAEAPGACPLLLEGYCIPLAVAILQPKRRGSMEALAREACAPPNFWSYRQASAVFGFPLSPRAADSLGPNDEELHFLLHCHGDQGGRAPHCVPVMIEGDRLVLWDTGDHGISQYQIEGGLRIFREIFTGSVDKKFCAVFALADSAPPVRSAGVVLDAHLDLRAGKSLGATFRRRSLRGVVSPKPKKRFGGSDFSRRRAETKEAQ